MYWLYLPLALAALHLATSATHAWRVTIGLPATVLLIVAWAHGRYRNRLGGIADAPEPDIHTMIDPAGLYRLRDLAQARMHAATGGHNPT